jgi:lipopolysaccharide/colanic/teichoic acid biosynthesis glycosyltransferase
VEELHDRLWASAGILVVRRDGGGTVGVRAAGGGGETYLLVGAHDLVLFAVGDLQERLRRKRGSLLFVRLSGVRTARFVERVVTGPAGEFHRLERDYRAGRCHHGKCALTDSPEAMRRWQAGEGRSGAWRSLRGSVAGSAQVQICSAEGQLFDGESEQEVAEFFRSAVSAWRRPDLAVPGVVHHGGGVWSLSETKLESSAVVMGGMWVGLNPGIGAGATVVGPGVLWDARSGREAASGDWSGGVAAVGSAADARVGGDEHEERRVPGKRAFDVVFGLLCLLLTLPLYPVVMLAIWLEDGRPFFYGHRREGRRGREFTCWKFRSMRKDADRVKAQLQSTNEADGPQFFMLQDPRLTKVGRMLRRLDLDELPQFWNVLRGEMSVVGPRPSPHGENQYCPEWREVRLSVRPGMTGLWQVKRTRQSGTDFQEWIQYDVEYVDCASWLLDLRILGRTMMYFLGKTGSR